VRGVKLLRKGCAVTDLIDDDRVLRGPLDDAIKKARLRLRGISVLAPVLRDLGPGLGLIERGSTLLGRGDVCGGAALTGQGARALGAAAAKSARLVGGLKAAIYKERTLPATGDVGEKDLRWAGLNYRQGLVDHVAAEARILRATFAAGCARLGKKVVLRGRVLKIDAEHGLLTLVGGRVIKLSRRRYGNGIAPGARVKVEAHSGGGGPWIGESIGALDTPIIDAAKKPCVTLLIAPAQDFTKTPTILHAPSGYEDNDMLWLEAGMRVAASKKCAGAKPNNRYSLAIEAESSNDAVTVAADLGAGAAAVPLGLGGGDKSWTLTVTERRQGTNCGPPSPTPQGIRFAVAAAKAFPCPVIVIGTTTYEVRMASAAGYASAIYDQPIFDLETNPYGKAKVIGLVNVNLHVPNPSFEAEGFKIVGVQSENSLSKITSGIFFAVWPEASYGFPLASPLDAIGVDHYAGLVWPRIVGTRNGKPYRYRAKLPQIVTDLPPNCSAADCFYRLPWAFGTKENTIQGNAPNPPGGHNGKQAYAWDFIMGDGYTILATRGGVVGDLVESNTQNFNPCDDPNADGPANFIRIDHQDGTYSYYAHIQPNGVFPSEGAVVKRGDQIGLVGNTGRSCAPHLHYQVSIDSTDTIYGQTTEICFETDEFGCYIPKNANKLVSTNG
jgi:murein DD-endopeptidase MepM/ murein hydrolase activator NlpD